MELRKSLVLAALLLTLHRTPGQSFGCQHPLDVVYLLDGSDSVLDEDWPGSGLSASIQVLRTLLTRLSHTASVRHSVLMFSTHTSALLPPTQNLQNQAIASLLSNMRLSDEAASMRQRGVEVFAVSVGQEVNLRELQQLASSNHHVFHILQQNAIATSVLKLLDTICVRPPSACQRNCDKCTSDGTVCLNCSSSHYLQHGKCFGTRSCDQCADGFYWEPRISNCKACTLRADLTLLIDSSGSIRDNNPSGAVKDGPQDNWWILKRFLSGLISSLDIGFYNTRVAAVKFSTKAHVLFKLDTFQHRGSEGIQAALQAMTYDGHRTNISGAIWRARSDVFAAGEQGGNRLNVRDVILLITDGKSTVDSSSTIPQADLAKKENVTFFVVGITNKIDVQEVHSIASDPDLNYYFNSPDIKHLSSIRLALLRHVCSPALQRQR